MYNGFENWQTDLVAWCAREENFASESKHLMYLFILSELVYLNKVENLRGKNHHMHNYESLDLFQKLKITKRKTFYFNSKITSNSRLKIQIQVTYVCT